MFYISILNLFCEICDRKLNSNPSYYRHRTWSQLHLLKEQLLLDEAGVKELERKINPQINVEADAKNQPFLVLSQNHIKISRYYILMKYYICLEKNVKKSLIPTLWYMRTSH